MTDLSEENLSTANSFTVKRFVFWFLIMLAVVGTAMVLYGWSLTMAPTKAGDGQVFTISPGASVRAIAADAEAAGLVRSDLLLYSILIYQHDPTAIQAGRHIFSGGESVWAVAEQLATNITQAETLAVTFPEGITLQAMSKIVGDTAPDISAAAYLEVATGLEGYLFPETYHIPLDYTASDLVSLQQETLAEVLAALRQTAAEDAFTEAEILTLASIIEREANSSTSMRMVSGILQNRLSIDMPLQADATIEYVLDTPLNELAPGQLAVELREQDSPYNTYLNLGLPPTPIGNPGRDAIAAALQPTPSDYLFYITGNDGEFYYAETLAEHNQNIARYLR